MKARLSELYLFEQENYGNQKKFYENILQILDQLYESKNLNEELKKDIQKYLQADIEPSLDFLTKLIQDKEKMSESDKIQLEKLINKNQNQKLDYQKKIKEVQDLADDIEKVLESGTESSTYKMLELIESKIVLGVYKTPLKTYPEIDYFMKQVDKFFKEKNYMQDDSQIKISLSVMLNVSNDFLYRMTKAMQDFEMDEFDWAQFYDQGRETHLKAMEYYRDAKSDLEEHFLKNWNELIDKLNFENKMNDEMIKWMEGKRNEHEKLQTKGMNLIELQKIALGHISNEFFHSKKQSD